MPINQPLTEDPRFKDNFPWQMDISNEEFMSWTPYLMGGDYRGRTRLLKLNCSDTMQVV